MKATLLTLLVIATAAFSVPALADPPVEYQRDDPYRYDRDYHDRDYHEYSRDRYDHDRWYRHRHHHHHPEISIEVGR
jgi:hypothetical protein